MASLSIRLVIEVEGDDPETTDRLRARVEDIAQHFDCGEIQAAQLDECLWNDFARALWDMRQVVVRARARGTGAAS